MSVPTLTATTTRADGVESSPVYAFGVPHSFIDPAAPVSGPIFDITDYGAIADPAVNNQPMIQAAIDAAHAAGGGVVYIPPGTFGIAADPAGYRSVHVLSNVYVQGAGMGESVLRLVDGHEGTVTGLVRSPWGEETSNWGIADLTIDGNKANTTGQVDGFFTGPEPGQTIADRDVTVMRVEIENVSRYGFDPHELTERLTIQDSVAHDNAVDGFVLDRIVEANITGNESYDNGRHGFNIVTTSQDLLFTDNVSHDNGGAGFVVQRGAEIIDSPSIITFSGGESYGNGREGVLVQFSDHVTIEGMDIHDNGRQGVRLFGSTDNLVQNNTIHDNSQEKNAGYSEVEIEAYQPGNPGPANPAYGADGNTISGNTIYSDGGVRAAYGVEEIGVGPAANDISSNAISGMDFGAQLEDLAVEHYIYGQEAGGDVVGTSGNDRVAASSADSTLYGKSGDDQLIGGSGNDVLDGGKGNDVLTGGAGNDILKGGSGDDRFDDDAGNDTYSGGSGIDRLDYANSGEAVALNASTKTVTSASGADTFSSIEIYSATQVNDTIRGSDRAEVFIANGGDDLIRSAGGRDTLSGGEGNDTFLFLARDVVTSTGDHRGVDTIMDFAAGDIIDVGDIAKGDATAVSLLAIEGGLMLRGTINGQIVDIVELMGVDSPDDVTLNIGTDPNAPKLIFGTDLADTLVGAEGRDELHGAGGDDVIKGKGDNDKLFGEAGNDAIYGGAGNDMLNGGAGNDLLRGGDGNDGFFGGGGDDIVMGERGDDTVFGDGGSDELSGSSGTDTLYGGSGADRLHGGSDNDQLYGQNDDDVLAGNSGDDLLDGGAGNDLLYGHSGNDSLDGGAGNDVISGGSGNDHIYASVGADAYDGDGGLDTLDFSRIDSGVTLNASAKTATGPSNTGLPSVGQEALSLTFDSIESFIGSAHDDNFRGSDRTETFFGGAGNDLIRSAGGADSLSGGEGTDVFQFARRDILDSNGNHRGIDVITDYQVGDVIDLTDIGARDPDGPTLVQNQNGMTVMATIDGNEVAIAELHGVTSAGEVTFGSAADIFAA